MSLISDLFDIYKKTYVKKYQYFSTSIERYSSSHQKQIYIKKLKHCPLGQRG